MIAQEELEAAREAPQPGVRRVRVAVSGVFGLVGVMLGTWFACLPRLRTELGLSYGQLGVVLLAQTAGVLIAMQVAGRLTARFGTRLIVRPTAVIVPWFLPLMAQARGMLPALAAITGWGMVAGLLDVGMNAQAVGTERAARRQVLNSLHAVWSVGALVGSLLAVAAARAGLPLRVHFLAVAAVLTCIALASGRNLLNDDAPPAAAPRGPGSRPGLRAGWTAAVVLLGLLAACASLCESAVSSWCGIFLQQRDAAASVASLGYTAFVVAETVTRMAGDRLHARLGAVALVRCGLAVTAAGVALAIGVPRPWLGIAGFAIQGCGIAVLIPIITGAAGHGGGDGSGQATSLALARFSTLYYGGALFGPAVIGWLAQAFGVGRALGLLIVPLAVIALLARATAPASIGVRGRDTTAR